MRGVLRVHTQRARPVLRRAGQPDRALVERVHGAHQNFERIARNHFMTFVRQAESNASAILPNHYSSVRHDYNLAAAGAQLFTQRAAFCEVHGPLLAGL
jgi:hypothetical protein